MRDVRLIVPQSRINPSAFQGGFLTIGSPGKSLARSLDDGDRIKKNQEEILQILSFGKKSLSDCYIEDPVLEVGKTDISKI